MWQDILSLLWIFLPAGYANTAPVLANNIPLLKHLNQPLDLGKSWRSVRIFGDHKTIRGLLAGMLVGLLVVCLQVLLVAIFDFPDWLLGGIDYSSPTVLLMGLVMGFGAIAGDAIKSFFKRRAGKKPGENWPPFDQIDFMIGGYIAALPFVVLPLWQYIAGLFLAMIIHPIFNILAWLLKLQDKPF